MAAIASTRPQARVTPPAAGHPVLRALAAGPGTAQPLRALAAPAVRAPDPREAHLGRRIDILA